MEILNTKIFGKKTFSNILEEIYKNQTEKKTQVLGMINHLRDFIKDSGDATLLVPLIKEYLDISVKNDDHLIKLANLIQKVTMSDAYGSDSGGISEEEKEALLKEYKKIKNEE